MTAKTYSGSKTVAYASLNIGELDLNELGEYCLKQHSEVDTFAEETDNFLSDRPLLNHVLHLIEQQKITHLIVPSVDHVLGSRFRKRSEFLNYLRLHGVWLYSLADDSNSYVIH